MFQLILKTRVSYVYISFQLKYIYAKHKIQIDYRYMQENHKHLNNNLRQRPESQKMYKFQIRFAETGHPQIFQQISSIQMLQQLIFKQFKIQIQHQKLYSKKGMFIKAGHKIDCQSVLKKTFTGDQNNPNSMTQIMGIYLFNHKQLLKNQPQQKDKNTNAVLYQQSKSILKKRHEYCQGLRPKIYELQNINKKFDMEQLGKVYLVYPNLKQMHSFLLNSSEQMMDFINNFKQNQQCLDLFIQKWENQRKALLVLLKNLSIMYQQKNQISLKKLVQQLNNFKETFKSLHGNQQNLGGSVRNSQQNLGNNRNQRQEYLYNRRQLQISISDVELRIRTFSDLLERLSQKIKQFGISIKSSHKELQKPLKQLDHNKKKNRKQIEGYQAIMKQNYSNFIQAIKIKIQKGSDDKIIYLIGQRKKLQEKYGQFKAKISKHCNDIEQRFYQLYCFHAQHQQMVRTDYKKYYSIFVQLQQHNSSSQKIQQQFYVLYKRATDLRKIEPEAAPSAVASLSSSILVPNQVRQKGSKKQSPTRSLSQASNNVSLLNNIRRTSKQMEQAQISRRMNFYYKMQAIQQQIKQIYRQEQKNRKKFLQQILSVQQLYDSQIMTNINVPCILINYHQTSDLQLLNKYKNNQTFTNNSSLKLAGLANFNGNLSQNRKENNQLLSNLSVNIELYKQNGMDRVLKELESLKYCQFNIKADNVQSQTKLKNLQVLLQKSADIFHHIYNHKLKILTKSHQSQLTAYTERVKLLQRQKKQLQQQIYNLSKNIQLEKQYKKQLQRLQQDLQRQNSRLKNQSLNKVELQHQFAKELQQKTLKIKKYEGIIEDNKRQISKLKNQRKQIEQRINDQLNVTMEMLYSQFQKVKRQKDQLQIKNNQYKIFMGDQAIQIQTLQAQKKILEQEILSFGSQDDRQKKINNFVCDNNKKQIDKLKQSFYGQNIKYISDNQKKPSQKSQNSVPSSLQNFDELDNMIQPSNMEQPIGSVSQMPLLKRESKSLKNQQINQVARQVKKLQRKIVELTQQKQELEKQVNHLTEQINQIVMKDTEDIQVQTQSNQQQKDNNQYIRKLLGEQQHKQSMLLIDQNVGNRLENYVKIDGNPQAGQTRIFIPFSQGIYVAIQTKPNPTSHPQQSLSSLAQLSSQTRNYLSLHQTELHSLAPHQQAPQTHYPYILDLNCLTPKGRELLLQCTLIVVLRVGKILPGAERNYVEGEIVAVLGFEDEEIGLKDYGRFVK